MNKELFAEYYIEFYGFKDYGKNFEEALLPYLNVDKIYKEHYQEVMNEEQNKHSIQEFLYYKGDLK